MNTKRMIERIIITLLFSLILLACGPITGLEMDGTRVVHLVIRGSDGLVEEIGLYDNQLHADCSFSSGNSGNKLSGIDPRVVACFPTTEAPAIYEDKFCMQPIISDEPHLNLLSYDQKAFYIKQEFDLPLIVAESGPSTMITPFHRITATDCTIDFSHPVALYYRTYTLKSTDLEIAQ